MQAEHQMRTRTGTTQQTVDGTATRDEMLALPRWESFPQEDRQHVISVILQTARRQRAARPAGTTPSR
jgi:predicted Fe-S protein YdhL (DUF1289 family)